MPASHVEIEKAVPDAVALSATGDVAPRAFPLQTVGRSPEGGLALAFKGLTEEELDAFLDKALFSFNGPAAQVDNALFNARQEMRHGARTSASEIPQALKGEWWIEVNDKPVGPVSFAFIEQQWDEGVLGPDNFCWRKGYRDWVALSRVPEAVAALSPVMLDAEEIEEVTSFHDSGYQSQMLKQVSFARLDSQESDFSVDEAVPMPVSAVSLLPELHAAELEPEPPTPAMQVSPYQTYAMAPPVLYPQPDGLFARVAQGLKSIARVVFT